MSNIVYELKLFNEVIKREFINQYKESTRATVERIFKVSQSVESDLNKDLFDFNREQIRRLLFLFMPKTEKSSAANVAWISSYIQWASEEGYTNSLNPLDSVGRDWSQQFVNKANKLYWSDLELDQIIRDRVNAQDGVIPELLRNGVRGTANSEITNLKAEHIDVSNRILTLTDADGTTRNIMVSQACIDKCLAALGEIGYEKKNGKANPDTKAPTAQLVQNNYVVKSVHSRTEHFDDAEKNVVHRRLSSIAKELDQPHFTPMNICYSGMISKARDLYYETGRLDDDRLLEILKQFDEDKLHSLSRFKSEFLNTATIIHLYPK
ncbi:MAG: breaking-rejoining enzyme [Paenibacillus sp.]|jgi:hypothetical protein|nr:breaking-rejoining enzyme [Paenibacillus sp.]